MRKGDRGKYEQLWNSLEEGRAGSSEDSSEEEGTEDTEDEVTEGLSASQSSGPLSLPQNAPHAVLGLGKKEGLPPCPPPRPGKSHARSASLDLNHLSGQRSGGGCAALSGMLPSVPPRGVSEGSGGGGVSGSSRDLHASIHSLRESVALLARTVGELGQEVSDTTEERVVLEYQLEQLRSIGRVEQQDTQ